MTILLRSHLYDIERHKQHIPSNDSDGDESRAFDARMPIAKCVSALDCKHAFNTPQIVYCVLCDIYREDIDAWHKCTHM